MHCGDQGTGQVAKVCNNLVLGISMIGVSEAMNLGMSSLRNCVGALRWCVALERCVALVRCVGALRCRRVVALWYLLCYCRVTSCALRSVMCDVYRPVLLVMY